MTAGIGHNRPEEKTPFDEIVETIDVLYEEAKGWCDGEPVTTQGQADELNKLLGMIRQAEKDADALRKSEVKPFDDGKKAVQERFNPLIGNNKSGKGKTVLAQEAVKQALTPWLIKLDEQKRAEEAKAREEAEAAARAAEEARKAAESDNLAAKEEAERLEKEAAKAQRIATTASKAKATAKGGEGRAIGLRATYRAEVTDEQAFAKWIWTRQRRWMSGWLAETAKKLVAENPMRPIDGVTIHETKKAV